MFYLKEDLFILISKPRVEQKRSPKPRAHAGTAFASKFIEYLSNTFHMRFLLEPPSHSLAPWDVTQWIDPVQARNPKLAK